MIDRGLSSGGFRSSRRRWILCIEIVEGESIATFASIFFEQRPQRIERSWACLGERENTIQVTVNAESE